MAVEDFNYLIVEANCIGTQTLEFRATAYARLADRERAENDFNEALKIGTLTNQGFVEYGDVLKASQKYAAAYAIYERANSADGQFGCALVRIEQSQQPSADFQS